MTTLQVHLPANTVERVRAQLDLPDVEPVATGTDQHGDEPIASLLRSLARSAEQGAKGMYAHSAAEFLAVHLATGGGRRQRCPAKRQDARVRRAIAMMRENIHRPITLAEPADEVNLSPSIFCASSSRPLARRGCGTFPACG
ncbi:hypothetical protein AB0M86_42435 [Streptomyces sp. NPDC051639]|uniref:hypothetical protein n=1 Tax=Streptomyces sp. NPDC051639 TaxID=3155671 RepID=UPI0034484277